VRLSVEALAKSEAFAFFATREDLIRETSLICPCS
jgi:hypothetical protein